jgi:hypothetical protein
MVKLQRNRESLNLGCPFSLSISQVQGRVQFEVGKGNAAKHIHTPDLSPEGLVQVSPNMLPKQLRQQLFELHRDISRDEDKLIAQIKKTVAEFYETEPFEVDFYPLLVSATHPREAV